MGCVDDVNEGATRAVEIGALVVLPTFGNGGAPIPRWVVTWVS